MNFFESINLDELIRKVVKEKCEIIITIEPDRAEIQIEPWKPFVSMCPYREELFVKKTESEE